MKKSIVSYVIVIFKNNFFIGIHLEKYIQPYFLILLFLLQKYWLTPFFFELIAKLLSDFISFDLSEWNFAKIILSPKILTSALSTLRNKRNFCTKLFSFIEKKKSNAEFRLVEKGCEPLELWRLPRVNCGLQKEWLPFNFIWYFLSHNYVFNLIIYYDSVAR